MFFQPCLVDFDTRRWDFASHEPTNLSEVLTPPCTCEEINYTSQFQEMKQGWRFFCHPTCDWNQRKLFKLSVQNFLYNLKLPHLVVFSNFLCFDQQMPCIFWRKCVYATPEILSIWSLCMQYKDLRKQNFWRKVFKAHDVHAQSLQLCLWLLGILYGSSPSGFSVHGLFSRKNTGVGCWEVFLQILPTQG